MNLSFLFCYIFWIPHISYRNIANQNNLYSQSCNGGIYITLIQLMIRYTIFYQVVRKNETYAFGGDIWSKTGVTLPTGRKWAVQNAVNEATSRLKHQHSVGKVYIGRQELGFCKAASHNRWDTANNKERRKMITDELRNIEED